MCYIDVRPLASFFMDNNIIFDIRNYIESKYPKLTLDEIDLIASDIQRRYDYSPIESQVEERLKECAYYANIKLDDDCNIVESQFDGDRQAEVKTYEKIIITRTTTRAVLIIKFSLSSICAIMLSAFSDIRI